MEILEKFLTSIGIDIFGIDILLDSGLIALYIIGTILEIIFLAYLTWHMWRM